VFFARIDLAVNILTVMTQVFLTGRIVRRIGIALALAALPLVCVLGFAAVGFAPTLTAIAANRLMATAPESETGDAACDDRPLGGGVLDGIRTVFTSPYLLGIAGYMLLYTITATFLYFQQAEITVFFARIDLAVNILTVMTQVFLTGRIVRRIGIALALAALPLVCVLGFAVVGIAPTLMTIAVFQVLRRSSNYAIARPCREMLYTVIPREAKYKAKNFIDTFVYRFGDQVGAWSYAALGALGLGAAAISMVAAPLAAAWLGVGLWLGRRQKELASPHYS
jgi:AAA family ATP:ADP antiporter